MKNHDLARSVGSQYGNQLNIIFRCENLHSLRAKFIRYSVLQFVSRSRCLKMSRFPKSSFNRLRISPTGNSLLILVGTDLNLFKSIPTKINKEFPIETIRSRLNLDFGKRDIFKHGDKL